MIVRNALGIPVYVPEWDDRIPAGNDGEKFEITSDRVRSAPSLRSAVAKGYVVVLDHDQSDGIQAALAKMSNKAKKPSEDAMLDDVVIRGQFLDYSGYGKVNRGLVKALTAKNISVSVDPVDLGKPQLLYEDARCGLPIRPRCQGMLDINSVVPTFGSPGPSGMRVLYTTVESETIPDAVVSAAKKYERVWCVSRFCCDTFGKYGIDAGVLSPHINGDIFCAKGSEYQFSSPLPSFKFFTIFGMSSRKVGTNVIESFLKEFDPSDDACLIVAHRDKRGEDAQKQFADVVSDLVSKCGKKHPPLVVRMSKNVTESDLAKLYRSVDACVLAARGEGFCLPYAEAAMCGIPSVAPRFGGQLDFLDDSSAFLVDVERATIKPGTTGTILWDGTVMADTVGVEFIQRLGTSMRLCWSTSPKKRNLMASRAASKLADMCSADAVVSQFKGLVTR